MIPRKPVFFLFTLIFLISLSNQVHALVLNPDILGIDFRFNNPGARANAMGGAFIGLADDATAAYTNPAGLTILSEPEISIEYKVAEITTFVYDNVGPEEYDDTVSGTSFLSFAYPTENITITLFRHQLVNIDSNFTWRQDNNREYDEIESELDAVTLGIGAGIKMNETFSIGFSIGYAQLDYDLMDRRFDRSNPNYPEENQRQIVDGTENDEHYTVSILWNPLEELGIGLVYRTGPEFENTKKSYRWYPDLAGPDEEGYLLEWEYEHVLKIPDQYGIGISYRFLQNLTACLDINRVEYSDIADNFIDDRGRPDQEFDIPDTTEIHFGLEYIFDINETPIALRCGYYYLPAHRVDYKGDDPEFERMMDKMNEDDHIFSIGLGVVISKNLQIDISGSYGDYITEGSLSIVYRFD